MASAALMLLAALAQVLKPAVIAPEKFDMADRFAPIVEEVRATWSPGAIASADVPPELQALLGELDAPDFAVRQAASVALLSDGFETAQLFRLLSGAGLSTEQRLRLLAAAKVRILDAPRGALGIRMAPDLGDQRGVRIQGLLPGMPAQQVLRVGDLIDAIDGNPVTDRSDLISIIQAMQPGDRVRLSVARSERDARGREIREGGQLRQQRIECEVVLGAASDLERYGDPRLSGPSNEVQAARMDAFREAELLFGPKPILPSRPPRQHDMLP